MFADPKSAKKTDNLTIFFALLGSARVKAAQRTLMKLIPGIQLFIPRFSSVLLCQFPFSNKTSSTIKLQAQKIVQEFFGQIRCM